MLCRPQQCSHTVSTNFRMTPSDSMLPTSTTMDRLPSPQRVRVHTRSICYTQPTLIARPISATLLVLTAVSDRQQLHRMKEKLGTLRSSSTSLHADNVLKGEDVEPQDLHEQGSRASKLARQLEDQLVALRDSATSLHCHHIQVRFLVEGSARCKRS